MRPSFKLPPPVKLMFPVGSLLDIPTGEYLKGTHDQRVLLGGISMITGIVGPGNSFKTTLMRFMVLSAINRLFPQAQDEVYYSSYDTEINANDHRNAKLTKVFTYLKDRDILQEGIWQITNKDIYTGNEYWTEVKNYLKAKRENKKARHYKTAFLDRDGVSPMTTPCPSFGDIDSLSQFVTADVEKTMDTTELGESAGNTIFMRQGLAKARLLMEMPTVIASGTHYELFTAHVGATISIPSAPGTPPPRKQLQHMPAGDVIKGVSNNFFYLLHNLWYILSARPFINQGTKAPEYPYEPGDEIAGDNDLMCLTMKQLRGKNGSSGYVIEQMVSQREGVLPYLSEFHYVKSNGRFGLEGNDRNYALSLVPDVSLSRTTVRKKLRESPKLQRAVELTSELCQLGIFHPTLKDVLMTPGELKKALEDKGYDWEFLLTQTRSWHTLDDEEAPLYPFSTLDMCRAARGEYTPYWLEADNKTVKKQYASLKGIKNG